VRRGKRKEGNSLNLLDLKPRRNLQWETQENGSVVLLVPKFRKGFLAKLLSERITKPNFRVKLDPYGSYAWNVCDGNTTVGEIAEKMSAEFGQEFDQPYERTGKFVQKLLIDDFLIISEGESVPRINP